MKLIIYRIYQLFGAVATFCLDKGKTMAKSKSKEVEAIYASPWVMMSASHFIRYQIDLHHPSPNDPNDKHVVGKVIGKTKKGIAHWTWFAYQGFYAKTTGTCTNKRDAIRACDVALQKDNVLLLKQKHMSFL